jgi:hypothetical protein
MFGSWRGILAEGVQVYKSLSGDLSGQSSPAFTYDANRDSFNAKKYALSNRRWPIGQGCD